MIDRFSPFNSPESSSRHAQIVGGDGKVVFEQDVVAPVDWSDRAVAIVAQKYFRGAKGTPERESGVMKMVERVSGAITVWGHTDGYFQSTAEAHWFERELNGLLLGQFAAFNSPVFFNVGIDEHPQASACFISHVDDDMGAILDEVKTEGLIFKKGSGVGTNLSNLRSSKESLSGGGTASGPVSFMRGYDAMAGVIKSGGKTRRSAIMRILNADHPDIFEFVQCKAKEGKKQKALLEAGFSGGIDGEATSSIAFQNANNSVRVTDEFMRLAQVEFLDEGFWQLVGRDKRVIETIYASDLLNAIAEAAWECGDPGMQFHDTINRMHTCPNDGEQVASNPCSEYMWLDNTSCNLASLNLAKFLRPDGSFNAELFAHAVQLLIVAQDILVHHASYPTEVIAQNTLQYRTLGLGYANLGSLLMRVGLPYDSEEGRTLAAGIASLMTAVAYTTSARLAEMKEPFPAWQRNAKEMAAVIVNHRYASQALPVNPLTSLANQYWDDALNQGDASGFRNAQVTVLAPTGTIAFMMDCDTTGVEPELSLVKHKTLSGGGVVETECGAVRPALDALGYAGGDIDAIAAYIHSHGTAEGAPRLKPEHLAVFDCAFRPANGTRSISPMAHVAMMSAIQPFISGAISKTVNMPAEATVEDVKDIFIAASEMGVKAIAIYRDGSKGAQPMKAGKAQPTEWPSASLSSTTPVGDLGGGLVPQRRKLPDTRKSVTHKFSIAGHEGYLTVGLYGDGQPGELFVTMSKEGSTISGLVDSFAIAFSHCLQSGVPLMDLVEKFKQVRFEPAGITKHPDIRFTTSVVDYIARFLEVTFVDKVTLDSGDEEEVVDLEARTVTTVKVFSDGPPCPSCGTLTQRAGSCHSCPACGSSTGCG